MSSLCFWAAVVLAGASSLAFSANHSSVGFFLFMVSVFCVLQSIVRLWCEHASFSLQEFERIAQTIATDFLYKNVRPDDDDDDRDSRNESEELTGASTSPSAVNDDRDDNDRNFPKSPRLRSRIGGGSN